MRKRFLLMMSVFALYFFLAAQATAMEAVTVRGRLGRTVEAGGWLIIAEREKYLILNPQQFQNETWFRQATPVEAVGETRPGAITIYQEGIPFQVRSMRPLGNNTPTESASLAELTRVLVTGEAVVQAQPDTAIVVIAVVTQSQSALEAQQENANRSDAVVRTVKTAGPKAEVKTSGYSLQPQMVYRPNESPTISGYIARNSIIVTMSDLSKVGAVIDAAARAGANSVDNLSFTLRQDRPARDQALAEATREALGKAKVVAQSLGGRVVRVVEVQEASAVRQPIIYARASRAVASVAEEAAPTPIAAGTLDIRSQVQLVAEIEIK